MGKIITMFEKESKLIHWVFGVSIAVLLSLLVFTYSRLKSYTSITDLVKKSLEVQNDMIAMKSGYRALVALQRSYLVTKDPQYFQDFQQEKDSLRHTLSHFNKISRTNKTLQSFTSRLETNITQRIQSLLVEIINDTTSAQYKFEQQKLIAKNQELNEEFSKVMSALYAYERQEMEEIDKIKTNQARLTPVLMLLTGFLATGVILYTYFLLFTELKKRRSTEELLQQKVYDLHKSNQELEQYAYVASHDLQEPLRKLRTFGEILKSKYGQTLDLDGLQLLDKMEQNAARMTQLIKDLLSLSRLLSEKPSFEKVALGKLLDGLLEDFEEDLRVIGAKLERSAMPTVLGSESQLKLLFQNLLGNAIKFRKAETPLKLILNYSTIKKWQEEREFVYHQITLRDNGLGFNNDQKEYIFSIFGRLAATKHVSGTGIGLSICKRIMENHEGFIFAEGKEGEGALFTLQFPNLVE